MTPDRSHHRLQHAIGLADMATALAMMEQPLPAASGLTIRLLPGRHGVLIWSRARETAVLHVDVQGHVRRYLPGRWEQVLLRQWQQGRPALPLVPQRLHPEPDRVQQIEHLAHRLGWYVDVDRPRRRWRFPGTPWRLRCTPTRCAIYALKPGGVSRMQVYPSAALGQIYAHLCTMARQPREEG